jgi:hypothetical protein
MEWLKTSVGLPVKDRRISSTTPGFGLMKTWPPLTLALGR